MSTERPVPAAAPRRQTRIGPRQAAEEPPPEAPAPAPDQEAPAHLPDEWQELIHSPEIAESLAEWPAQEEAPAPEPAPAPAPTPPPRSAPRRTVVGRRAPEEPAAQETPPLAPETPSAAVPNQAQAEAATAPSAPAAASPAAEEPDKPAAASQPPVPATSESAPPEPPSLFVPPVSGPLGAWLQTWQRWGGQALTVSVLIHLLILAGGTTIVISYTRDEKVDFLPGGSTQQGAAASQALEHKIQQKKTPWIKKPMAAQKIAAAGSISDIVLPDEVPDLMDLPQAKSLFTDSRLTPGMGLSGAGGIGSTSLGSASGAVFQPFSMFGMQIKSRRLAVILDVSGSMAPHLPRVIEEVDKVAKGSTVILFVGCGLQAPPPRGLEGDEIIPTSSQEFEKFWRMGVDGVTRADTRNYRIDRKAVIQNEAVFNILSKRPQTYFIHAVGLSYTWLALLSDKTRSADGIYWFSDFQDQVDFKQINIVRENLQARKQRLYMHAYMQGSSYDLVRTQLVEKTGGDVFLEQE